MVAIAADYRVQSRHQSTVADSDRYAKTAITLTASRPNALVLFNPVVLFAPVAGDEELTRTAFRAADHEELSPWHHLEKNDPPTIIFHGKPDTTVPYAAVESFAKKMQAAGNRRELVGFDGQVHGFFNYRPAGNKYYDETLRKRDEFLGSLGYWKSR
jgi:acetyl esterase/lipase